MNHICPVCENPAYWVCIHSQCEKNPFVCNGRCDSTSITSNKIHTHNGRSNLALYDEVATRISDIQNVCLNEHINSVQKRINLIIGDINQMFERYKAKLSMFQLEIKTSTQQIIQRFKITYQNHHLTGKEIRTLFNYNDIYENQQQSQKLIDVTNYQIQNIMKSLENLQLGMLFHKMKGVNHYNKAQNLREYQFFKEAAQQYILASKCDHTQPLYPHMAGYCYARLLDFQNTVKYSQQSIDLNAKGQILSDSYFNIGTAYQQKKKNQIAIDYFSKAIQIQSNIQYYYFRRARAYQCLHKYEQSQRDYSILIHLNPLCGQYYKQRALIYKKLKKFDEAKRDIQKTNIRNSRAQVNSMNLS